MPKSTSKKTPNSGSVTQLQTKRSQPDPSAPEPGRDRYDDRTRQPGLEAPELHIHHLFGILARRWVLIVATVLFGAFLAGAAATLIPPKFTARAQIVVEPEQAESIGTAAVRPASVDASAIDTQITMLAARNHLRTVLASLADDPAFTGSAPEQQSSPASTTPKQSGTTIRMPDIFAELHNTATGALAYVRKWIGQETGLPDFHEFERTLRIDQERQSRIISVRYTSKSAVQAATAANRVVELYVGAQAQKLRQASQSELAALDIRIAKTENALEKAETAIQQKLAITDYTATGQSETAPLRKLQREVTETAQLYVTLLARQKQLRSQQGTTETSVRVLALAEPPGRPSSADAKYFVLPAIILSLIGGSVLAVTRERFDRTLRSERQVHGALGIPCSALVPKLSWIHKFRPHDYLLRKPFSPYAEAYRSIWASLQFAAQQQPLQIVLVSSSVRGEGRTTLATSLATYAAHSLPRVILIDLDFRHPAVAPALKLEANNGLLDLIETDCPVDDIVQHVPELKLDVLTVSGYSIDPVTIFADGKLHNTLQELRNHYDLIIIDGPPLLGVAEAGLLASLADTVLFAVKWGVTRSDVAQNAVRELQTLGWSDRTIAERVRAVVTHVNLKRHASYKYGDAVELLVRRGHNSGPTQAAPALKTDNLKKLTDQSDGNEPTVRVAAE